MILYHGTTITAFQKIKNEGLLQVASPENSPYSSLSDSFQTNYGYVYLTASFKDAVNFADMAINCNTETPRSLCIIKVKIPDEYIEPDKDELRIGCAEQPDKCFRVKGDIDLKQTNYNSEYTLLKFKSYQSACDYIDSFSEDKIEEISWKSFQ